MYTDGSAGASPQVGKLGREEEAVVARDLVAPAIGVPFRLLDAEVVFRPAEAMTSVESIEATHRQQGKTWRCAFCASVMTDEVATHRIPSEPHGDGNKEVDLCSRCCGCDGE